MGEETGIAGAQIMEAEMANGHPIRELPSGKRGANWKGGRTKSSHGDTLIWVGKGHPLADIRGYAYEHRLNAWESGQDIEGKHVHHEDEDTQNNSSENLEALTIAEHRARHRKVGSNLRLPDEPNRTVKCACGCGESFEFYDVLGRPRSYVSGHNPPASPTADKLLSLIQNGTTKTAEIIRLSGLTKGPVCTCLSKLRRQGKIQNIGYGEWGLING